VQRTIHDANAIESDAVTLLDRERMIGGLQLELWSHVGADVDHRLQVDRVGITLDPIADPTEERPISDAQTPY
jgi:hypothetical protein